MYMPAPIVVVLEGLDYSGKTTQCERVRSWLDNFKVENGQPTVIFRDPGGTMLSEQIRKLVKDATLPMSAETQFFLFLASRCDTLRAIEVARQGKRHVVVDRWWPSTFAYQGALGIDRDLIVDLAQRYTTFAKPFFMLYLDIPVAVAMERRATQGRRAGDPIADRFDDAAVVFKQKLADGYRDLCTRGFMHLVNAEATPEEVTVRIGTALALNAHHSLPIKE